jgi:hypothetical protein
MKIVSLDKIVAEAAYLQDDKRRLEGPIRDVSQFRSRLQLVEAQHHGIFSFLAFHYASDRAVADYIIAGSIADDAGPHILALFLTKSGRHGPRSLKSTELDLGVNIASGSHPAYELVRWWFPADPRPTLPGVLFLDGLVEVGNAVYVSLDDLTVEGVTSRCRKLFRFVEESLRAETPLGKIELDFDAFCRLLNNAAITYLRTGGGLRRRLDASVKWIEDHREQIACVIRNAAQLASKVVGPS